MNKKLLSCPYCGNGDIDDVDITTDGKHCFCPVCATPFCLNDRKEVVNARPSKDEYYLSIAETVLTRSTCLRRKYGAVIVKDDEIISTGYNGAPRGMKNCCDTGYCYREEKHIPHGEHAEWCEAVHAEANAIISASRRDMIGSTLYLAGFEADGSPVEDIAPCAMCQRLILNAGIAFIVMRGVCGELPVRKEVKVWS